MNKFKFLWPLVFIVATFILANSHFKSSSNDSKYYTELVVRYHDQTWQNIITPKWGENYWSYDPNSYDLDNFPGQLIIGVVATKLGAPPDQALHIVGMLFQVLSIFLLVKIAKKFIKKESADVLYYAILLTPMAFAYNLRANHELGIMFFSLLALYSGLELPSLKRWGASAIVATVMLMWIKGPFFIFGIILTVLGFYFSPFNKKNYWRLAISILLELFLVIGSAIYFDQIFKQLIGISFIEGFWNIQITGRQLPYTHQFSFITLKLYNFYYYSWHLLTYALPWFLFLIIEVYKNKISAKVFFKSRLSLLLLLSVSAFLLIFSVNSRHAARYIFPAYYFFSTWSIIALLNISVAFQKLHIKITEIGIHLIAPILWLLIFSLHFL